MSKNQTEPQSIAEAVTRYLDEYTRAVLGDKDHRMTTDMREQWCRTTYNCPSQRAELP